MQTNLFFLDVSETFLPLIRFANDLYALYSRLNASTTTTIPLFRLVLNYIH